MKHICHFILTVFSLIPFAVAAQEPSPAELERLRAEDALIWDALDAFNTYDIPGVEAVLRKYADFIKKYKMDEDPEITALRQSLPLAKEMMAGRVERVVITDSILLPKDKFLEAYKMDASAGYLIPKVNLAEMGDIFEGYKQVGPAWESQDHTVRYMSLHDSDAETSLYETFRKLDGTWADPEAIYKTEPAPADTDEDEADDRSLFIESIMITPFMMPDGCTFYFAATRLPGLGGYDIFRANRDSETGLFQAPVNLGMPYNSPGDDYMFAIDEVNNRGWWATTRNAFIDDDGQEYVTVYSFTPSAIRVNYPPDEPLLRQLAALWTLHVALDDDAPHRPGWTLTQIQPCTDKP